MATTESEVQQKLCKDEPEIGASLFSTDTPKEVIDAFVKENGGKIYEILPESKTAESYIEAFLAYKKYIDSSIDNDKQKALKVLSSFGHMVIVIIKKLEETDSDYADIDSDFKWGCYTNKIRPHRGHLPKKD